MKAIQVKHLGPTDTRGSRVKAFVHKNVHVTLSYDYTLTPENNRLAAAYALIKKLNWPVNISGSGILPNGDEIFTIVPRD